MEAGSEYSFLQYMITVARTQYALQDELAQDQRTHGSMFCPVILGSDKTTVSVATGQNEYWPLYVSLGNIHNHVRRAHRNAVVVLGFLAMPKSTLIDMELSYILTDGPLASREYANDEEFRKFRRQLYHTSLVKILRSITNAMTEYAVFRCPDGHFRRVIFGLGPFIGDYPEQVLVACIVQGWCPK